MSHHGGSVPAGWYQDPESPGEQRYWDGTLWTEHRAPGRPGDEGGRAAVAKGALLKVAAGLGALFVALILLAVIFGDDEQAGLGPSDSPSPGGTGPQKGQIGAAVQGSKMNVTVDLVGKCTGPPACVFEVTYENVTNEPQEEMTSTDDLILVDTQGRRFESESFDFIDLQPGQSDRQDFSFENLPEGFVPDKLEVDSAGAAFEVDLDGGQ